MHLYGIRVRFCVVCETESAPLWYVFVFVSCARLRVHLYGIRVRIFVVCETESAPLRYVFILCRVCECARNIVNNSGVYIVLVQHCSMASQTKSVAMVSPVFDFASVDVSLTCLIT